MAKSASGLSLGPTNGEASIPNENRISEILIANMILEYGEARPLIGSVRIINTIKVDARHDMPALTHLITCAVFRLKLMLLL